MVRSALALAALATTAVPGLDVVATRPPQRATTDFQTTGLLDGGGRHWVIRAPLHPAAGASLEGEVELLANLAPAVDAGRLPFAVPRPAGFAALPEGGRAMVYRELVGRPLDLDRLRGGPGLSAELGRALAAFHELDTAVIADAGLPVYDAEAYRRRCLAEVDEAARTGHVPSVLLNRWEHALEDVALWRFRATPVHGDLAPEHVLVHDGQITALLSLADAHVGDPAEDLGWLMAAAPEDALDAIEEAYALARTEGPDGHLLDRALLVSELALARWLLHGVRTDEQAVVDDAAAMLRQLAADVEDAPGIGAHEPVVVPDYTWPGEDAWADVAGDAEAPAAGADEVATAETGAAEAATGADSERAGAGATEPTGAAGTDPGPGGAASSAAAEAKSGGRDAAASADARRHPDPAADTEPLDLADLPDFLAARETAEDVPAGDDRRG
ncbi:phosphotransferase [Georgenia ruanii]|uniref:Phosphotransferase n=1 Tax=Georgenia ruanii TaxID=348442 RepID=A0A7J9URU7_9MICO|nr:phosphotransferase [Georgenia ruanii]MPV87341.1 phosphotransferase [Georgenia ruanii]